LVDRGVDLYRVDKLMYDFGMAMGPFRTNDLSGNDVGKFIQPIFQKAYGHRFIQSSMINLMVDAGRLGEKTGKGITFIKPKDFINTKEEKN
jgi:3-hydroxyacyl-CoA dehydrogenase